MATRSLLLYEVLIETGDETPDGRTRITPIQPVDDCKLAAAKKILGVNERTVQTLASQGHITRLGSTRKARYDLQSVLNYRISQLNKERRRTAQGAHLDRPPVEALQGPLFLSSI